MMVMKVLLYLPALAYCQEIFFGEDHSGNRVTNANSDAAQSQFLARMISADVEDFESFGLMLPPHTTQPALQGTINGVDYSVVGDNVAILNTSFLGAFAVSGTNYMYDTMGDFELKFAEPVVAFGFYGADLGDIQGQLEVNLLDANGVILKTLVVPHSLDPTADNAGPNNGAVCFFGVIVDEAHEFSSITFSNTNDQYDFFGFDDFTVGRLTEIKPPNVGEPCIRNSDCTSFCCSTSVRRRLRHMLYAGLQGGECLPETDPQCT